MFCCLILYPCGHQRKEIKSRKMLDPIWPIWARAGVPCPPSLVRPLTQPPLFLAYRTVPYIFQISTAASTLTITKTTAASLHSALHHQATRNKSILPVSEATTWFHELHRLSSTFQLALSTPPGERSTTRSGPHFRLRQKKSTHQTKTNTPLLPQSLATVDLLFVDPSTSLRCISKRR